MINKYAYIFILLLFCLSLSCQKSTPQKGKLPIALAEMKAYWENKHRELEEYKREYKRLTDAQPLLGQKTFAELGHKNFPVQIVQDSVSDFYQISFRLNTHYHDNYYRTQSLSFKKDSFQNWKLYHQAFSDKILIENGRQLDLGDDFTLPTGKYKSLNGFIPSPYTQLVVSDSFVLDFKRTILDSLLISKQPHSARDRFRNRHSFWAIEAMISRYYFTYNSVGDSTEDKLIFPYLYRACQAAGVKDTALMRILSQYNQ